MSMKKNFDFIRCQFLLMLHYGGHLLIDIREANIVIISEILVLNGSLSHLSLIIIIFMIAYGDLLFSLMVSLANLAMYYLK